MPRGESTAGEACRRLYADLLGRFPNAEEAATVCQAETWGQTVSQLLDSNEFVRVQQRRWADKLLYNNRAVNFERAWDMDDLVGKAFEGRVAWGRLRGGHQRAPVIMRPPRHARGSGRVHVRVVPWASAL